MIYFLRHGESQANLRRAFAGQKDDSPLTEKGRAQAANAAKTLQGMNIKKIITTSLIRASDTAQIIADALGCTDITIDDRLLEYDMGALTGTQNKVITSHDLVSAEGAENPEAFRQRVLDGLRDAKHNSAVTLIVSHAGVGRIIEAERRGIDPRDFHDIDAPPNAQPVVLDLSWLE